MVRNYIRKTNNGPDRVWSSVGMIAAIEKVKSKGMCPAQASAVYEIPETTLKRYFKAEPENYPIEI